MLGRGWCVSRSLRIEPVVGRRAYPWWYIHTALRSGFEPSLQDFVPLGNKLYGERRRMKLMAKGPDQRAITKTIGEVL